MDYSYGSEKPQEDENAAPPISFFVYFHVSNKLSFKPLFSFSIPSFAVGMAKLLLLIPLIFRELKTKNW